MVAVEMTQSEIQYLLCVAKKAIIDEITLPSGGEQIEFNVVGNNKNEIFAINIYRGNISNRKFNVNARFTINNVMLMQLHISPTNRHINPDGNVITGDHWHIYDKDNELRWAYPAENIQSDSFVENTIKFLERFIVIKRPMIIEQLEL
jgi:hypothetical protein